MKDSLILEGKIYISARRVHDLFGYATDYVGQLCRAQKLDCKMIGRSWYVSEKSIVDHKMSVTEIQAEKNKVKRRTARKIYSENISQKDNQVNNEFTTPDGVKYSYIPEIALPKSDIALPEAAKEAVLEILPEVVKEVTPVVLPVAKQIETVIPEVKIVPAPEAEITHTNKIADAINEFSKSTKPIELLKYEAENFSPIPVLEKKVLVKSAPVEIVSPISRPEVRTYQRPIPSNVPVATNSSRRNIKKFALMFVVIAFVVFGAGLFLSSTLTSNSLATQSSHATSASVATVADSIINSIINGFTNVAHLFARLTNHSVNTQNQLTDNSTNNSSFNGMAVVPSKDTFTDEETKKKILASFSDNVSIYPDASGGSGVIKPEFKKVSDDSFLYVLVPVKDAKQ